jgi:hypothetical protein
MKKLTWFATVLCLICCYSMNAFGAEAGAYLGFTSATVLGAAGGQTGMNQACVQKYGLGTRICTVDEFFNGARNNSSSNAQLWVQPVLHNCLYDQTAGVEAVMCTEAGVNNTVPESNLYNTCNGWTSSVGLTGTSVLFTSGVAGGWATVTDSDCSVRHPVACCSN